MKGARALQYQTDTGKTLRGWKRKQKSNGQFPELWLFLRQVSFSRFDDNLNSCFYFYFKEFLTAWTTHSKRSVGIECSILEDDLGAMGAVAYVELFLIHICWEVSGAGRWFWGFRNPRSLVNKETCPGSTTSRAVNGQVRCHLSPSSLRHSSTSLRPALISLRLSYPQFFHAIRNSFYLILFLYSC